MKTKLYPEHFPTPPDEIRKEKLDKIIETELTEWKVVTSPLPINPTKERVEIYRELIFETFDQVVDFINLIRPICNILPHHPRWENTWRTLKIYLSTWDSMHIITYKDIMLARNIEMIYRNEFENKYDFEDSDAMKKPKHEKEINQFINDLKGLIAKNKVREVFDKLDTFFLQNSTIDKPNELFLIQARYASLMEKLIIGDATDEAVGVEMAKINAGLLTFLVLPNFT